MVRVFHRKERGGRKVFILLCVLRALCGLEKGVIRSNRAGKCRDPTG